jgi:hypothetical protein
MRQVWAVATWVEQGVAGEHRAACPAGAWLTAYCPMQACRLCGHRVCLRRVAGAAVERVAFYFPPIFIGLVTYLVWKRGLAKGTYAKDPDVTPSAVPAGG